MHTGSNPDTALRRRVAFPNLQLAGPTERIFEPKFNHLCSFSPASFIEFFAALHSFVRSGFHLLLTSFANFRMYLVAPRGVERRFPFTASGSLSQTNRNNGKKMTALTSNSRTARADFRKRLDTLIAKWSSSRTTSVTVRTTLMIGGKKLTSLTYHLAGNRAVTATSSGTDARRVMVSSDRIVRFANRMVRQPSSCD